MKKSIILFIIIILTSCTQESTTPINECSALIRWEPPYTRVDGSILNREEILKYTIYISSEYSTNTDYLLYEIDIENVEQITFEMKKLSINRKYYFYMTATDTNNLRSKDSNILEKNC